MALTRLDILNQASGLIQDPNHEKFAGGVDPKNDAINRIQRRILLLTELNKASIVVTFANGTSNGTVAENTHTVDPTITYEDWDGWPTYDISDMQKLDKPVRWIIAADGSKTRIWPVTQEKIDDDGLLMEETDGSRAKYYQMLTHKKLRFLPLLGTTAYPWKVFIDYRKLATDMATDGAAPSLPEAYHDVLTYAVAGEWEYMANRPEKAAPWETIVRQAIGISIRDHKSPTNDRPPEIAATWKNLCE